MDVNPGITAQQRTFVGGPSGDFILRLLLIYIIIWRTMLVTNQTLESFIYIILEIFYLMKSFYSGSHYTYLVWQRPSRLVKIYLQCNTSLQFPIGPEI